MNFLKFFGKNPRELFLEFEPQKASWSVVSWNFDLEKAHSRQWSVEIHGECTQIIKWLRTDSENEIRFFKNHKLLKSKKVNTKVSEFISLMNLAIHSTVKHGLETHQDFMLSPVSGATAFDMQAETRALQWIQASFGTLSRALDRLKEDRKLILTAVFFSGRVPETGEIVVRLIAFNLDIFYYLKPDHSLQIVVFDDKGEGHGQSRTPTFQQIIKVTKPQFYDEIIKLLNKISQIGELG